MVKNQKQPKKKWPVPLGARRLEILLVIQDTFDRSANQCVGWLTQDKHEVPAAALDFGVMALSMFAEMLAHLKDFELNAFLLPDAHDDQQRHKRFDMSLAALGTGVVALQTLFDEKRRFDQRNAIVITPTDPKNN